jgi:pimeloyl-ACP methyl ester carboxylesterase
MGRGFVEPIDRFSEKSKPAHPELLDALCEGFAKDGTRLRPLMRTILRSRAYQASSAVQRDVPADWHASMALKPMNPVQVLNLLSYTLNMDVFLKEFYRKFAESKDLPETYRNPEVFRMYLHQFTSGLLAPAGIAPEETSYTGSVRLALKLMNSNDLQGLVKAEWGRLADILKKQASPEDRLGEITAPALVVHGTADAAISMDKAEALVAGLANAELLVVEGGTHSANLTHPAEVNAAIQRFLAGLPT